MKDSTKKKVEYFFSRHVDLNFMKDEILRACTMITDSYLRGGKLLICGNGGSCADSEHIAGELMKGFLLKRPLDDELKDKFKQYFGEDGRRAAQKLQGSLPAISLSAHSAFNTAFINDVEPNLMYAQQVIGYAKEGDVILGISTSGNAENVYYALMAGIVKGMKCIGLCGRDGGRIASVTDCCIIAPSYETFEIQEYHLAIYHFICAYVECEIFDN